MPVFAFSRDPVINAVHQNIKRGISVTYEHECFGSCVVLIYSAIDTMAFLGMPANKANVSRKEFICWVDRYLHFPCAAKIAGVEWYAARCATLHTFGTEATLTRNGEARQIGYMDMAVPEVIENPAVSGKLVLVSIAALRDSLFSGIDSFLVDLFSDSCRTTIAEERLSKIFNTTHRQK